MRISGQVDRSGWMVSASRFIPGRLAHPDLARFCPIRKGGSTRPCHRGGSVIRRTGFSARIAFDPPCYCTISTRRQKWGRTEGDEANHRSAYPNWIPPGKKDPTRPALRAPCRDRPPGLPDPIVKNVLHRECYNRATRAGGASGLRSA
jgi:hypothetical protein